MVQYRSNKVELFIAKRLSMVELIEFLTAQLRPYLCGAPWKKGLNLTSLNGVEAWLWPFGCLEARLGVDVLTDELLEFLEGDGDLLRVAIDAVGHGVFLRFLFAEDEGVGDLVDLRLA